VGSNEQQFPSLVFTLPLGLSTIGRSSDCTICLPDPTVSRRHADLTLSEKGLELIDIGSLHGLRVNGVRTKEAFIDERNVVHLIQIGVLLVSIEVVASSIRPITKRLRISKKQALKRTALVQSSEPVVADDPPTEPKPEPPKTEIFTPGGDLFQPQQAFSARWLE
jgi:hypothetical protein